MAFELAGGPQDGELVEELPEGYTPLKGREGMEDENGDPLPTVASWQADLDALNKIIDEQGYDPGHNFR